MTAVSLFLALVLIAAAGHKVIERDRLATSAAVLTGASVALGPVISLGAASVEAMAALALIFPASRSVGSLLAASIWAIYGLALIRHYGSPLDCGCNFVSQEKPVDVFTVFRAFGLSALGLAVFAVTQQPFALLFIFAALGFFALYLALGELLSITISKPRGAL
jgi:hypothetical protein